MKKQYQQFAEIYINLCPLSQIDPLAVKLLAILHLQPRAISMEDLAKISGLSLASVSNKAKILESRNLLTKSNMPGSRKVYLESEKNLIKAWQESLQNEHNQRSQTIKHKLPELVKQLKTLPEASRPVSKDIKEFTRQIQEIQETNELLILELQERLSI